MSQIRIEQFQKVFRTQRNEIVALRDIDLTVEDGQFVCLLDPSGCRSSMLPDAVTGFSPPRSSVSFDRHRDGETERGMVFQEYALFPWMTVAQNIGFGLSIEDRVAPEKKARVEELLRLLALEDVRDRSPRELCDVRRRRVAIARVLALDSPVLLLDQPFAALDAATRRTLQDELLRIWAGCRKTILFVTHSIEESIYLADRVVVLARLPGQPRRELSIRLPRPREPGTSAFHAIGRELDELVMAERVWHERARRAA